MRIALIREDRPSEAIQNHPKINYIDNVFKGRNVNNKDHDLLDNTSESNKVTILRLTENQLVGWVREYITGNNIEITRGRSTKEILDMAGLSEHPEFVTSEFPPEMEYFEKMKYNELRSLAVEKGLKVGNMKKKAVIELLRKGN